MAFSSGDVLESRSDEEPSESLPWNIIALMRPVQQQWLWPRFSLFFSWWLSPLRSLMLCMCSRLLVYLWHNISRLCGDVAYGCSRQHDVSLLFYFWVICLISLLVIENLRLMLLIWPFCIKGIHMEAILNKTPECTAVWALYEWHNHWTDAWNVSYPCWDL